jgi:hypothetical protein
MASTYNLDKNKFYLVSEITQFGPRGMDGSNGLPGPVYQNGKYIDITENRVINSNLETGTYLKIVDNVLSSNLIAGINMEIIGNILNSNINSNININESNIISSIGNITFYQNLNGVIEIINNSLGSSINDSNSILKLINNSSNVNIAPTLEFYKNSPTPASSDIVGLINYASNTTLLSKNLLQTVIYACAYPTVGSISGNYNLALNGLHYLHLNASNNQINQINTSCTTLSTSTGSLVLQNYLNGAVQLGFLSERAQEGGAIALTNYSSFNSTLNARRDYGQYFQNIRSNTSGLESGFATLNAMRFGTIWEFIRLEGAISTLDNQSAVIFNNGYLDIDLLFRSISFSRLIHCDAANNSIGIATNPVNTARLSISGNIRTTDSVTIPNIIIGSGVGAANLIIMGTNRSTTAGSLAAYLNITINGVNRKIPLYNP